MSLGRLLSDDTIFTFTDSQFQGKIFLLHMINRRDGKKIIHKIEIFLSSSFVAGCL